MKARNFSRIFLIVAICLVVQNAQTQIEIPETGNEALRGLDRLLLAELSSNPPFSNSPSNGPLGRMPAEKIWKMAEEAMLLRNGFPTFRQYSTLKGLIQVIGSHPEKSRFVDLMLRSIAATSLPTKEPEGWNEIAIMGDGGVAGLLISGVTTIAEPADCQRIVDSIAATHDVAKITRLREAARLVKVKDEFDAILKQVDSGPEDEGQYPAKLNTSLPPPLSSAGNENANTGSPAGGPPPKQVPEPRPPPAPAPGEEPVFMTLWCLISVLVVVAAGLVWRVLKRRP